MEKDNEYDYVIVGGGPTGMSLAWLFGSKNRKVLLIERDQKLGGCHRVQRVDGYFSEHGPRVYSNSYIMFIELLKDMDIDFFQIFTEANTNISKIDKDSIATFTLNEKKSLAFAFIRLIFNPDYGKKISIKTFIDENNFTNKSKDYIDRFCRLTDGATSEFYITSVFTNFKSTILL
jgi:protoporphyrinogen oxidase